MSQLVARSGTILVPSAFGATSRLYRFWSSQIDSLTEFCSGSRVSTLTALAMTSVSTELPPEPLPPPPPPEPPLDVHAVATAATTASEQASALRRRRLTRIDLDAMSVIRFHLLQR